MKFYTQLSDWWPLFSPPTHYVEEADDLLARLAPLPPAGAKTLLELGSGGGSLACHLKQQFKLTLTDLSEGMLAQNRAINPEAEFVTGDMRTIRLHRQFDYVLVHDAVCYMTTIEDLRAAIQTAAMHCRPDGKVVFLPDYVTETFSPGTDHGGEDGADGRAFRYLEWHWDPDPADTTYLVDYAFLLREANGACRAVHDRHIEGLFPRAQWLDAFARAGLDATSQIDPFGRDVFIGQPR
ncbi:MAG TPA: class I SAM-dependent methyltransferase [Vicinamibacterales bacterium]|nr:class I SAM-dependent methyltransferase [Vicinamibacterales bacterium]